MADAETAISATPDNRPIRLMAFIKVFVLSMPNLLPSRRRLNPECSGARSGSRSHETATFLAIPDARWTRTSIDRENKFLNLFHGGPHRILRPRENRRTATLMGLRRMNCNDPRFQAMIGRGGW